MRESLTKVHNLYKIGDQFLDDQLVLIEIIGISPEMDADGQWNYFVKEKDNNGEIYFSCIMEYILEGYKKQKVKRAL